MFFLAPQKEAGPSFSLRTGKGSNLRASAKKEPTCHPRKARRCGRGVPTKTMMFDRSCHPFTRSSPAFEQVETGQRSFASIPSVGPFKATSKTRRKRTCPWLVRRGGPLKCQTSFGSSTLLARFEGENRQETQILASQRSNRKRGSTPRVRNASVQTSCFRGSSANRKAHRYGRGLYHAKQDDATPKERKTRRLGRVPPGFNS